MGILTKDSKGAESTPEPTAGVKVVPADEAAREGIRAEAERVAREVPRGRPILRGALMLLGLEVVRRANADACHLGFAMVSVNSAFWRDQFAAVPAERRLLLLPHCLRRADVCRGDYDADGLLCAGCGACILGDLKAEAEALGYRVLIAEGTPVVVRVVLNGSADAILGVACLDSLDSAFDHIAQLGVPNVAVPLLVDGCQDTVAEVDLVREWMHLQSGPAGSRTRSYVPLLRAAQNLFDDGEFEALLGLPEGYPRQLGSSPSPGAIAIDWLRCGGKRFRPFISLASYAAMACGPEALSPDADVSGLLPQSVKRLALGVEALHKASLVHDDIEDDDPYRYGRETLHRRYGVRTATAAGDYLIGVGYRCMCAAGAELGDACAADLVRMLAGAHVRLCRGQGAELRWHADPSRVLAPQEVQSIYALKTAPALEAAMTLGMRAAVPDLGAASALIRRFGRYLGVAYQVANDLKDWEASAHDKRVTGRDLLSDRPTMLRALAAAAGVAPTGVVAEGDGAEDTVEALRALYDETGVFTKARHLVQLYKDRARALAEDAEPPAIGELMRFIAETIL